MRENAPSFSRPIIREVVARRIVDAKSIALVPSSIVMGKTGVPQPVDGTKTLNKEKSQIPKETERKRLGTIFLRPVSLVSLSSALRCYDNSYSGRLI
jgi:hypothetical protein